MIKLWEKCEVVKIVIKRGVQNTNSELMVEELKVGMLYHLMIFTEMWLSCPCFLSVYMINNFFFLTILMSRQRWLFEAQIGLFGEPELMQ